MSTSNSIAGRTIVVYTDGVSEARRNGTYYGEPRIAEVAAATGGSAAEVVTAVLEDVLDFQHGRPHDDIAVLALRTRDQPLTAPASRPRTK